jgi:hypothetical protein
MVEEPFGVTVCGDELQRIPTGSAGQVKFAARLNLFWGETVTWSAGFLDACDGDAARRDSKLEISRIDRH